MPRQGFNNPTDANNAGHGDKPWINPTNVFAADNVFTTCTLVSFPTPETNTEYLAIQGFGFTIPATATITGLEAQIKRKADLDNGAISYYTDGIVNFIDDLNNADDMADPTTHWPITNTIATYGGDGQLFGYPFDVSIINSSLFGIQVNGTRTIVSDITDRTASIDWVGIKVYYTLAGLQFSTTMLLTGVGS